MVWKPITNWIYLFRKAEDVDMAYLVIVHLNGGNLKHSFNRDIDFTDLFPDFPSEGILVAHTELLEPEHDHHIG